MHTDVPFEVRQQWVKEYQGGAQIRKIAERDHYSPTTVRRELIAGGLTVNRGRRTGQVYKTKEQQDLVCDMYLATELPIAEVAVRCEMCSETVSRILRDRGITVDRTRNLRGRGRPGRAIDEGLVLRLHFDEGKSVTAISRLLGVNRERMVEEVFTSKGRIPTANLWGTNHPRWKGGRHITPVGYVKITVSKDDPYYSMTDGNRSVWEHRYVMAVSLGRPLLNSETVHHLDGNKSNNVLENLQLRQGAHGEGQIVRCRQCGSHDVEYGSLGDNDGWD